MNLRSAYVGIDLAFQKHKRLPLVVCTWRDGRLIPERLHELGVAPPRGHGNAAITELDVVRRFALDTAAYIKAVSQALGLAIKRIAIDAPSAPSAPDVRRSAEVAMDSAGISCFATPSERDFEVILEKVSTHLADGQPENRIPHANQLWMLVGFELFKVLSEIAPCREVYPQATARALGAAGIHKSQREGLKAQFSAVSQRTGWPLGDPSEPALDEIAFGPSHDRLDAYLCAWVAALETENLVALGSPPDDVIWVPRIEGTPAFSVSQPIASNARAESRRKTRVAERDAGRLCPACEEYQFKRWPFGWDAHAAHRCAGLEATEPAARKAEFKERFDHLFQS